MPEPKTLLDAVTRMIELTQQGKMKWRTRDDIPTHRIINPTSAVFYSFYNNRILRLYESLTEEYVRPLLLLEFVDVAGETLWTFPEMSALADLFQAVQYQVANVGGFLKEIFDEDIGKD